MSREPARRTVALERAIQGAWSARGATHGRMAAVVASGDALSEPFVSTERLFPWDTCLASAVRADTVYATSTLVLGETEDWNAVAEKLAQAGIRRVVCAAAGLDVDVAQLMACAASAGLVLEVENDDPQARNLVLEAAHLRQHQRPFAVFKVACTLDGKTATRNGDSKWITGVPARTEVHRRRARADAILVGIGTVRADDPRLTVRHCEGPDPLRVVLDTHLRMAPDAQMLRTDSPATSLVVHGANASLARREALQAAGAELLEAPSDGAGLDLTWLMKQLFARGVARLIVEGGATVHGAFLRQSLLQWATCFLAPKILGDPAGRPMADRGEVALMSAALDLQSPIYTRLGQDLLVEGLLSC